MRGPKGGRREQAGYYEYNPVSRLGRVTFHRELVCPQATLGLGCGAISDMHGRSKLKVGAETVLVVHIHATGMSRKIYCETTSFVSKER